MPYEILMIIFCQVIDTAICPPCSPLSAPLAKAAVGCCHPGVTQKAAGQEAEEGER